MNISCIYLYIITKFYITTGENSNKEGRIARELQKQCVKLRMKSLVITDISTYQVKFEFDCIDRLLRPIPFSFIKHVLDLKYFYGN